MPKHLVLKLLPALLVVILAGTAFAGGVVVSLDDEIGSVSAGTPFSVNFTIRSAHDGTRQSGFKPFVTATNAATGETLTFQAESLKNGQYAATLTLPSAGEWQWQITPDADYPKEMVAVMAPLQVQAAAVAAPVLATPVSAATAVAAPVSATRASAAAAPPVVWVAAISLGLLALGFVALSVRRRAEARS